MMAQDEFAIIQHYFRDIGKPSVNTRLSIGDDAAVVEVPASMQQVVCIDTLIAGVHFPPDTAPFDIACKALAVNLSDVAAMAAIPDWFLLSLTLPEVDSDWLQQFSNGLRQTAEEYQVQLIGGDTCRGDLSVSIQIAGLVPAGRYLCRSGAEVGDLVLVSGQLGNAGLGLAHLQGRLELPPALVPRCLQALNRPQPRLDLVDFLGNFASAAIDISDGLVADAGHIAAASGVSIVLDPALLPLSEAVKSYESREEALLWALTGGDDYELCFTLPADSATPEGCTRVGEARAGAGVDCGIDVDSSGGYRHF
jgi:thiamine-monophosphate kinase